MSQLVRTQPATTDIMAIINGALRPAAQVDGLLVDTSITAPPALRIVGHDGATDTRRSMVALSWICWATEASEALAA